MLKLIIAHNGCKIVKMNGHSVRAQYTKNPLRVLLVNNPGQFTYSGFHVGEQAEGERQRSPTVREGIRQPPHTPAPDAFRLPFIEHARVGDGECPCQDAGR